MDFSFLFDPNNITIMFFCVALCVVGLVVVFLFQFVGGILASVMGIFEIGLQVLAGGPIAWCGCLIVVFGCCGLFGVVVGIASIAQRCGTPEAVNFCRLLGY